MTFFNYNALKDIIQDRSIPEFVQEAYPQFQAFLNAYYEFLEQSQQTLDIANHLREYRDIDNTIDAFVDYFRNEVMVDIPTTVLADKRLLAKYIKNFYLAKGTENSFKFLFQILYGESVELYYPKDDVLRCSDGKWYQQKSVKIAYNSTINLSIFTDKKITGVTSKATAIVESLLRYTERGTDIIELSLSGIKGTFQNGEDISISYTNTSGVVVSVTYPLLEVYSGINLIIPGSQYSINSQIILRDVNGVEIGTGYVTQVSNGPISDINVITEGENYKGNIVQISYLYGLPINYTWDGLLIENAVIQGSGGTYNFSTQALNTAITMVSITYDDGDPLIITDSVNSLGNGAIAIVNIVNQDGGIVEILLEAGGALYQTPFVSIDTQTGSGAVLQIEGGGGTINRTVLETFPIVLPADEVSNGFSVYPDFTGAGEGNATGTVTAGVIASYPGRYLTEDGQLSSSKKLQDNLYYQDFSYVIKTSLSTDIWRDIVRKIIHPAGMLLFGEYDIVSTIDVSTTSDEDISLTISPSDFLVTLTNETTVLTITSS